MSSAEFNKDNDLGIYLVPPWTFKEATLSFLIYFEDLIRVK